MRAFGIIFLLLLFFCCDAVSACQISWRSQAELKEKADVVVVAELLSAVKRSSSFRSETIGYELNIIRTIKGDQRGSRLLATFEHLKSHVRAGRRICPLQNGSGIEHRLQAGAHYTLYLDTQKGSTILLAEAQE